MKKIIKNITNIANIANTLPQALLRHFSAGVYTKFYQFMSVGSGAYVI